MKILLCLCLGQPDVEGFYVFEFRSWQPTIFFWTITDLMYKVTMTMSSALLVNNVTDKVLFHTVLCSYRCWFAEFVTRE